jgi:hypothetical protein
LFKITRCLSRLAYEPASPPQRPAVLVSTVQDWPTQCAICSQIFEPIIYVAGRRIQSHHFHPTQAIGGIYLSPGIERATFGDFVFQVVEAPIDNGPLVSAGIQSVTVEWVVLKAYGVKCYRCGQWSREGALRTKAGDTQLYPYCHESRCEEGASPVYRPSNIRYALQDGQFKFKSAH